MTDRAANRLPLLTYLRVVWAVFLNGVLLGAVVIGFVVAQRSPDASAAAPADVGPHGVPFISALALMAVVFGQLLLRVLPARATKTARESWRTSSPGKVPPDPLLAGVFRHEWLIGSVILTVLAWVMLIAYLSEGAASDLVIAGLLAGQLGCHFPSRSWFDGWRAKAHDEWEQPAEPAGRTGPAG